MWTQVCLVIFAQIEVLCFLARSRISEKQILALLRLSVRPSGSQGTDFHKILYLRLLLKPIDKIQVGLISNKNKEKLYVNTYVHLLLL
jgi:hypothetical protein